MCDCENVGMGTYKNQVTIVTPQGKVVGIDRCIVDDVIELWALGYETIASCCGHNKVRPSIVVRPKWDNEKL